MVYYRRRRFARRRPTAYRKTFRRTRVYRKRPYRGRRRISAKRSRWYSRKYNFKEKFLAQQFHLDVGNTGLLTQGFTLRANQIPGWANRHPSFDQYKIYGWKITIEAPQVQKSGPYDEVSGSTVTGLNTVRQYLAYDFTDATAPSTIDSMVNCPITRTAPYNRTMKMYIRPALLKMSYETGVTTGAGYSPGHSWVDVDDDNVPHYGFKWLVDNSAYISATPDDVPRMDYKIWYTVYYGFKNCQKPGLT